MNDTNKKKNSGRIQETCEMGFSKCKKAPMKQHRRLIMLQGRIVLKLLIFGEGSSLVWFSKMHHNKAQFSAI